MSTTSRAFTLVELLVAIAVSSILIGITAGAYNLTRRAMVLDQGKADMAQNGRIAIDRLSRDLRQTPDILTNMPVDTSDTSVAQPGYLEFEDGHANDLTYKKYYVSSSVLKVDVKQYYFSYDTSTRVKATAIGTGGVSPVSNVISTNDIADNVTSISFYGTNVVQIVIQMQDSTGTQSAKYRTSILGRNL